MKDPVEDKAVAALKRGDLLEIHIDDLAFGGAGVGRVEDLVVFVEQALPGQKVLVRIVKKKKSFAEARLLQVLSPSPHQTAPTCQHFGQCGGCAFQHLAYEQQLAFKHKQVEETMRRLGGFESLQALPTLPSPQVYHYRNKMEFSFSPLQWIPAELLGQKAAEDAGIYLGLHVKGFFDKIIDVATCWLLPPLASEVVGAVRDFAVASGRPAYHARTHEGFWRFLVIRQAQNTPDLMVNLVATEYDEALAQQFKKMMDARFPQITSLYYSTTQNLSGVAYSEEEYLLSGNRCINEQLGPFTFEISSNSFFQTNTLQAQRLYDVVAEYAQLQSVENVFDLYCGAGTISLYVSQAARHVTGFESVAAAIADARRNATLNGVENCTFVLGDLRDGLSDTQHIRTQHGQPDVCIIDPPRGGMHPKTVEALLRLLPARIVHVSCNPATLARDVKLLCANEYHLDKIQPVDMFPHTAHIEAVALLQRNH